ncbi:MAG: Prenyltransferase UbiA [Microgenomates group bacterium GW2011_GWC1_39_7b]|uniref:Prenyltransferase UbiA n=3 Tax=Candidatus Woeseibacteriota TaxID=1752722 RepID=A0A0G0PS32_9BACT|nr:MAG: Prenyltransferase UbiA [Candidatus Woesebacteria bacterium GW2011_GWB1_39_10]KKR26525.1 MAG: Prenyltransferase UbiA [Microgenomates group bacterium GW2011_GWC1_39_7b]KKR73582.1 MAG: Prenyltransferase UbiA [Candidatus Woesebacteria bacterium GW2011_GWA2_40_7]KKS91106.1 MAG: Prenyltransferase UbiA [Candidatus Woesebacteria bacterium GW2011_GWA1_43_12]
MANLPAQKDNIVFSTIKLARPLHWLKNIGLFAALFLTGMFFDKVAFREVFVAFIAFNFATSATYVINDILDAKRDRLHPVKKHRPVASGSVPVPLAVLEAAVLGLLAFLVSASLNSLFFFTILSYLLLQLFYSLGLKNIAILDILIIATGFIIRVYAGAFVIDAHLSVWFLLCVISVALFLASGKRRAELNLSQENDILTRKSLGNYKKGLLNSYVTMFGNASWMSWALFTFFESPKATLPFWLVLAELSRTTTINKLLMFTIPVTIFGIMRYEYLIFEGKSETPEKLLLSDRPLIVAVAIWVILVYWVLYSGISVPGI